MTELPKSNSKFEIVTTKMGAVSIRDNLTQEIMHNPVGPWIEANTLYVQQSRLERRLSEGLSKELVIFDVGLGAAANALAVLHCARKLGSQRRPLRLVSFERDLELLKFALQHAAEFAHFGGYEVAVQSLLDHGKWEEKGLIWELRSGDFLQRIECEPHFANIIFYDPYSFKKNPEMWLPDVFRKVHAKCAADGILYTYSRATPIRVGLLLAGFFVGAGVASGPKDETTQASVSLAQLSQPLGSAWLEKWQRSRKPNAPGAAAEDLAAVRRFIMSHAQFCARPS